MTTPFNDVIDRAHELGFGSAVEGLAIMKHLVAHKHIWIVNDKTDRHAFAVRDITMKELQDAKLWPL